MYNNCQAINESPIFQFPSLVRASISIQWLGGSDSELWVCIFPLKNEERLRAASVVLTIPTHIVKDIPNHREWQSHWQSHTSNISNHILDIDNPVVSQCLHLKKLRRSMAQQVQKSLATAKSGTLNPPSPSSPSSPSKRGQARRSSPRSGWFNRLNSGGTWKYVLNVIEYDWTWLKTIEYYWISSILETHVIFLKMAIYYLDLSGRSDIPNSPIMGDPFFLAN